MQLNYLCIFPARSAGIIVWKSIRINNLAISLFYKLPGNTFKPV